MPQYPKEKTFLQELAELRDEVAQMRRTGRAPDELPMWATHINALAYADNDSYLTMWQTRTAARHASLRMGLALVGDVVSGTATGGAWQLLINSTVVASGSIAATAAVQAPDLTVDLTPYLTTSELLVELQTRRTTGVLVGGRYGNGGSIGSSIRYARLI